jgi:hypothetical protein
MNERDNNKKKESAMSNIPIGKRSKRGNEIVREKLEELGFTCTEPEKHYEDMIAAKRKCRIPVQAKPLPLTRTNNQTCVDDPSLEDFIGLYVVWVELRKKNDAFLYFPHEIFYSIMHERGYFYESVGKIRPHKNRWFLYIPRSLKGFERFADDTIPDRYCEDKQKLLDELRKDKSDTK